MRWATADMVLLELRAGSRGYGGPHSRLRSGHGSRGRVRAGVRCFEPVMTIAVSRTRTVRCTCSTRRCSATGGTAHLLIGHSAGAYYAQAMAARRPAQVAGLALVCPLLPGLRDVPEHRVVAGSGEIGDDVFRSYFVIQTPEMLERYERYVAPAAALVDQAALERIGERWALTPDHAPAYAGPTVIVAGRLDSTVGYAAATDLVDHYPHASLAVVDDAGHALPHEQPELLRALLADWLARVERSN